MLTDDEDTSSRRGWIESFIKAEGFIPLGITRLAPMTLEIERFSTWLREERHAGMIFLEKNLPLREDPRKILPGIKTAILFGLPYAQGDKVPRKGQTPRIAQYARMSDYHKVIWKKGEKILNQIHRRFGDGTEIGRVVTDSAPVLERALARQGGRGFIGKNTCFISPKYGSMILLGEILTSLDFSPSHLSIESPDPQKRSKEGGCGTCRRCQVHCPTGALDQDYRIDARKCLAYWTIEHRGPIPEEFWPGLERYIFGCDICQIVCPYNRSEQPRAPESLLKIKQPPPLFEIATMTQESYEKFFGGTPVTRAKREGLIRNALIAMAVTESLDLQDAMNILHDRREGGVIEATLAQIKTWLHQRTSRR